MDLTGRQCAILAILLRDRGETMLGSIGSELGVSARTVHRELARIAAPLRERYGLSLSGRSGRGLSLSGPPEGFEACRADMARGVSSDMDPEDRRRALALMLLDAPDALKTFALCYELRAPIAAVKRDLELLRPWFGLYGLSLISRKGLGVLLEGAEEGRRQAECSMIMEHYGEAGLLDLLRRESAAALARASLLRKEGWNADEPPGLDSPSAIVARLFPIKPFQVAERSLSALAKSGLPSLALRDYLGLVIHLGVAIARCARGFRLADSPPAGESPALSAEFDPALIARDIVANLAGAGLLPNDPLETRALARFLRGAKPERTTGGMADAGLGPFVEMLALIDECGRALGLSLARDRMLRDGLAAHWGPALYRVRNGIPIRNPMLAQILAEYAELFAVIRAACDAVFPGLDIPDDEIGYLVLHFGSAIARGQAHSDRFRALVICSAGIGSARMLASRIQAELPEIEIVANLSWFDVKDVSRERWDILVSTIPLPLDESEYVLVQPLLPAAGIAGIRAHLAVRRAKLGAASRPEEGELGEGSLAELRLRSRRLQAVIGILERISVFPDAEPGEDWDGFLAAAVNRCAAAGLVSEADAALRDLRERSRDFGIVLPASRVLFLHARSEGVALSSISLHSFDGAIPARGASGEPAPSCLALMLAPRSLDRETQDILNEISVSLLDAQTIELLQTADEASIKAHYSRYLDRYFRSLPM